MNYGLLGQILVVWLVLGVIVLALWNQAKTYYARKAFRAQLRELLNTSNESWAIEHRQWLDRRRGSPEVRLAKNELIRLMATEVEDYHARAFALDDGPPRAA